MHSLFCFYNQLFFGTNILHFLLIVLLAWFHICENQTDTALFQTISYIIVLLKRKKQKYDSVNWTVSSNEHKSDVLFFPFSLQKKKTLPVLLEHHKCLLFNLPMEKQSCYFERAFCVTLSSGSRTLKLADLILLIVSAGVLPVLNWRCEG